jgi:hypothetical protein
MVDPMTPDPMTQGMTGQEPDPSRRDPAPLSAARRPSISPDYGGFGPTTTGEGYATGEAGLTPVLPANQMPIRTEEGAPAYYGNDPRLPEQRRPPDSTDPMGHYQNYDPEAYARWEQEVEARGNEVRETAVGCFEVDSGGNIVSRAPSGYAVN